MQDGHIADCELAKERLPSCGLASHNCCTSCMMPWFDHLKSCSKCLIHITQVSCIGCLSDHCNWISIIWGLRSKLIEKIILFDIKIDGFIMNKILQVIPVLFNLDYMGIHYQKISKNDNISEYTFIIFDLLKETKQFMEIRNMDMDGQDLIALFEYLYTQELLPYFLSKP